MSIEIKKIDQIKTVKKPWGYEKWIADGSPDFKYALKEILFRSGYKSSIQFHAHKEETNYILKGKGILYHSKNPIDIKKFNEKKYSKEELDQTIKTLERKEIASGNVFHVKPGIIHRIEAINDLLLIESSTIELDDVYRLNDEWGRDHGKINKEHSESLKIYKNDIFKEQIARYDFAKTFAKGKILDVTMGKFMVYHGAHLLLENGAKEVWNDDFLDNTTSCFIRKFNDDKTMCFMKIEKINDEKFDVIFSNQTIQYEKEAQKTIERYINSLSKNGILIISTYNSKNKLYKNDKTDSRKINGFTKNDFQNLLENHFEKVSIFSQRNITTGDLIGKNTKEISIIKDDLRSSLGKMLLKFDKKSIFYKKHLQDSISRIGKSVEKFSDGANDIDYKPSEFKEGDNPLFFIAVCKK